jgi:hypothetical protein
MPPDKLGRFISYPKKEMFLTVTESAAAGAIHQLVTVLATIIRFVTI